MSRVQKASEIRSIEKREDMRAKAKVLRENGQYKKLNALRQDYRNAPDEQAQPAENPASGASH